MISSISSIPEITVLLACMRFYLGTATVSEVTNLLTAELDWSKLIQTAIAQEVMPLLYQSLKVIEGEYVPHSVLLQLQNLNRMNGLNNVSQTKELLKMLTELEKAGIEAIAFKGPVLAASAYGSVALRQFYDLDILVRRQDFWRAKAVLVGQGYQSNYSEEEEIEIFFFSLQVTLAHVAPEGTMFNQRFESSLLHSNPERSIDLHWGIPPRRIWNLDRFEQLFKNLNSLILMGQPIKTLSPEATLVIQSLNFSKQIASTQVLKQFCDAAQVIQSHPDLNWSSALELSSELGVRKLFMIGLYIIHDLLDIPLPQLITEQLIKNQPPDDRIFEVDRKSFNLFQNLWFKLKYTTKLRALDQPWDAIFLTVLYLQLRFKIWLLPRQRDRELLPLPNKLSFLYYILRPIRLLMQGLRVHKLFVVQNKN